MTRFAAAALLAALAPGPAQEPTAGRPAQELARERPVGALEVVATFSGPMPTGVTVSREGRVFVNFPRWGDEVPFTVGEVKGGALVPYPPGDWHAPDGSPPERLLSVQSVVVDPLDRLWILDTGRVRFGPPPTGGPKLVAVDLASGHVVKGVLFPADVATPETYLNDVRFDLRRGAEGMAFVTDSSPKGGLVAVDLATGHSWRRLTDHPSTRADPSFVPIVEGQRLLATPPDGGPPRPNPVGADGIAISADGERLFYSPLSSRHLYSVSLAALADPALDDARVAATVVDYGEKGASDGLESDNEGRVYATDYEHDAVHRRNSDGSWETLVHDPRVLWPDTLSLANGWLYFTANQLHRQARFHGGKDLRQKPYVLFRVKVAATPVRLVK